MTEKVEEGKVEEVEDIVEGKEPEGKVEEKEGKVEAPQYTEQEQSAISYGWMPKEKWIEAGHPADDWVPAKHFLKYGDLKNQVVSKDKQLTKQEKIIKMMKDHHLRVKETAYQEAMRTIKAERAKALEENDLAAAERLRDELDDLKERHAKEKALPAEVEKELQEPVEQPAQPHPEFRTWHAKNPWYIPEAKKQDDMSRTADRLGVAIVAEAQARGEQISVSEVYKAVESEIKKLYPKKFETPKNPQEESPRSNGKATGGASVKLTAEELAVAKAFDLTPEKYAEQLKGYKGR